jgi:uncharacterized protein
VTSTGFAPAAVKPVDLGTGQVCASFVPESGAWLSIGTTHPRHGFVELSAVPPFDESDRGNPTATRRYRARLTDPSHAFVVVTLDGAVPRLRADFASPSVVRWTGDGISVDASPGDDVTSVSQRWVIGRGAGPSRAVVRVEVRGRIDRPALAEITEVDPPAPLDSGSETVLEGNSVIIDAPRLQARAHIAIEGGTSPTWRTHADGHVADLRWPPDTGSMELVLEIGLVVPGAPRGPVRRGAGHETDPLTARALAYVRGCTALRVTGDECAILTDHRILPLSWTRDAYWQALLLLVADAEADRDRVADHLRWLWRRCERPDGKWVRSHHADGRRKDRAFQADQQLYPIVELADFWRATAALPDGVDWTDAVATAWSAALAEVDPRSGLMATTENAADDPAAAPFIAASQILLWYCASRLAEMVEAGAVALDAGELRRIGSRVRTAFDTHLAGAGSWAYASDDAGTRIAYHDANDLPVALAPIWGFCDADDPGWRATMRFAFSVANPGFVAGDRPGLGSAHTPGPWTLGDVQAWICAIITGDDAMTGAALERLHDVAFIDGMLPEAYTASGRVGRVRHWFAWPGAALAALRLLDADPRGGGLRRLRASR